MSDQAAIAEPGEPPRFRPRDFEVLAGLRPDARLALLDEPALKTMPRGCAGHAGAWYAPQPRLQGLTIQLPLAPEDWMEGRVAACLAPDCAALIRLGGSA